ncbi:CPBP family intramembrane metalloprotease [Massilia sp. IC2-278]|uniref:CPBP family intramembrane glutamic endopeptidase n=1 Tax=Massilia sp. IC2-278 TaxID=2887200 RepID=UPI001E2BA3F5|nr:CPBP family intramembrane glutamic endopeptidase [Massilia sp. IC2-278]MCC2962262.1 CPBP family intramembrane metalloprotease [Massilia sp. IC2-278]
MMTLRALLAVLALSLLLRGTLSSFFAGTSATQDEHMVLRWLAQVAGFALLFWIPAFVFKLRPAGLAQLTGATPQPQALLQAVCYGLLLLAFAWSEGAVETLIVAQFNPALAYAQWAFHADAPPISYRFSEWVAMTLKMVVLVPIVEEFFFRALLVGTLRKTKGMHAAAIFSSCLFTLLHYPRLYLVSTLVFAFALAYLYMASGSLLLCIAIHAAFNAGVLVLENPGWQLLARTPAHLDQPSAWTLELAVFLVSSALLLRAFFRYRHAVIGQAGHPAQNRSYSAR